MKRNFGEKNINFYLESAIKSEETKKRKFDSCDDKNSDSGNEKKDSDSDDDENGNLALDEIEYDEEVLTMVSKLPLKYITFGDEDKKNIIELFETVREVAINREYLKCDNVAASKTAKILSEINYYSTIKARTILRWYSVKDKECEKSGPKIDRQFESEIWGNLMFWLGA